MNNTGLNPCAREGKTVPAYYKTSVTLLMFMLIIFQDTHLVWQSDTYQYEVNVSFFCQTRSKVFCIRCLGTHNALDHDKCLECEHDHECKTVHSSQFWTINTIKKIYAIYPSLMAF